MWGNTEVKRAWFLFLNVETLLFCTFFNVSYCFIFLIKKTNMYELFLKLESSQNDKE